MARLSKERQGQIALMILKQLKKKEGLVITPEKIKEDAKNVSEEINIGESEALDFVKDFAEEYLTESLQELADMK